MVATVDYSVSSGFAMAQWRSSGIGCKPANGEITIRIWDTSAAGKTVTPGGFSFAILQANRRALPATSVAGEPCRLRAAPDPLLAASLTSFFQSGTRSFNVSMGPARATGCGSSVCEVPAPRTNSVCLELVASRAFARRWVAGSGQNLWQGRYVHPMLYLPSRRTCDVIAGVTTEDDIATVAAQLADLTKHVHDLERQLKERANTQQERAEVQQERIDLAARELAEVSQRLQAAADALRAAI